MPETTGAALAGRFTDAVAYAVQAHGEQVRKATTIPYASHLLAVTSLVLDHGGSEAQATAAVLHDVVEDCGGAPRLADVRDRFGDDVAGMVDNLSDAAPSPGEAKPPWRQRKQAYLDHLGKLVADGAPAVLVSACDKLHNATAIVADATDPNEDPGLAVFDRFSADAPADTAWYYRSLLRRYEGADLPDRLISALRHTLGRLEEAAAAADEST